MEHHHLFLLLHDPENNPVNMRLAAIQQVPNAAVFLGCGPLLNRDPQVFDAQAEQALVEAELAGVGGGGGIVEMEDQQQFALACHG